MSSTPGGLPGIAAVMEELRRKKGWEFEERLGRGGFGEVYRARVGKLYRAVRISLDPIQDRSAEQEHLIVEQMAKLQLLSHPRLVSLVDYDVVLGYLVSVWELADEPIRDLQKLLESYRTQGQVGIPRAVLLQHFRGLAEAVDFLNERGLYHRDIKPANCLLFQGQVKLADFGLTRFASLSQTHISGGGFGSLGYAPPESLEGKHHPSCDVYALAAMYAYLVTGRHPFGLTNSPSVTLLKVVERQRQGQWDLIGLHGTEADCVVAALRPNPTERFSKGAQAWVRALYQALRINREENPSRPTASKQSASAQSEEQRQTPEPPSTTQAVTGAGRAPFKLASASNEAAKTVLPGFPNVRPTSAWANPAETPGWYVRRGNQVYGPFSSLEMDEMARTGRLLPFDVILDRNRQVLGLAQSQPWIAVKPVIPQASPVVEAVAAPEVKAQPAGVQQLVPGSHEGHSQTDNYRDFVSKKIPAGVLGILLGFLGIHKFYLGFNTAGIVMLLVSIVGGVVTCGVAPFAIAVIGLVEGIIYLTKSDQQFYQDYCVTKKEWF